MKPVASLLVRRAVPAALALFALAPAARAADPLLALVPSSATGFVVVDHAKLGKHPHFGDVLDLLASQGAGSGLLALRALGVDVATAVKRSISFETTRRIEATVLEGKLDREDLVAKAKAKLGPAFASGEQDAASWFTVAAGYRMIVFPSGVHAVAHESLVGDLVELGGGAGKAVSKRAHFGVMKKAAEKGKPPVWGLTWIPESTRKALAAEGSGDVAAIERSAVRATGDGDMTVTTIGWTKTADEAKKAAEALRGKIDRKVMQNTMLKALGVAALASRMKLEAKAETVVAEMPLTTAQIGLLAKTAGKVLAVLH